MKDVPATRGLSSPYAFAAVSAVFVLLGLLARLVSWRSVFVGGHTELIPADSHYYVRLALLTLSERGPVSVDPLVAFGFSAGNYWPPLHTLLVSVLAGIAPDAEQGAAFVGPVAAVLGLIAVALVARAVIGSRGALVTVFAVSLTPVVIQAGALGNADHHVHEPTFTALTMLLAIAAMRGSTNAAVAAGLVAGGSRLFTTIGFVLPALLAATFVASALLGSREKRVALARGAALCGVAATGLLGLSVVTLGSPRSLEYETLSAFHPLLACSLFAAAVAACALLGGDRRMALRAVPLVALSLLLVPGVVRAMRHLGRGDPLLAIIAESQALITSPGFAIALFGPVLLALPVALVGAVRSLGARREPAIAAPLLGVLVFLGAAAMQARFAPALGGAAAVLLPMGIAEFLAQRSERGARWTKRGLALAAVGLLLALIPPSPPTGRTGAAVIRPTLYWMRDNLPPATADPRDQSAVPEYGVLAPFEYGHFIVLYAERPALASTFSQLDVHLRANRAASDIFATSDEEIAYRRLREARLRYVLRAPTVALLGISNPDRDGLYFRLQRGESLGHFRPIFSSVERRPSGLPYATLFEAVEGAVIEGVAPAGTSVTVALSDSYSRSVIAPDDGQFRVRVALPGTYTITGAEWRGQASVSEQQVLEGGVVRVASGP